MPSRKTITSSSDDVAILAPLTAHKEKNPRLFYNCNDFVCTALYYGYFFSQFPKKIKNSE
jgi:hypothetical protein